MQALRLLLEFLKLVVQWFDRRDKRKQREQHREEEQRLQDDPVGFGDEFFNGVRPDADLPGDAPGADPAKPAQLDPEQSGRGKPE